MANEIRQKCSDPAALTITAASLASSTTFVGRQSTLVDNSATKYEKIILFVTLKQGTSPTGSRGAYIFTLRTDGTVYPDGAGNDDAAITILNAEPLGALVNKASPSTGDVMSGVFILNDPGPKWGVAFYHDTGVNLDSTGSNHAFRWIGVLPEVQ